MEIESNELRQQRRYFHDFVAAPLFGNGSSDEREFTEFSSFDRDPKAGKQFHVPFAADLGGFSSPIDGNAATWFLTRYYGKVTQADIRVASKRSKHLNLAMISLRIEFSAKKLRETKETSDASAREFFEPKNFIGKQHPLTLADAQLLQSQLRRVFPRFHKPKPLGKDAYRLVGEGPSQVIIGETPFGSLEPNKCKGKLQRLLSPWFRRLLQELQKKTGVPIEHFGDDRAPCHMRVDVALGDREQAQALTHIHEADLYRLAEGDKPWTKPGIYEYTPDFEPVARRRMIYERHAPHESTHSNRSTWHLMGDNQCVQLECSKVFSGKYSYETYYQYMFFMCVFERAALLGFSTRLSEIVREGPDSSEFPHKLQSIRRDFLTFTHIHHFTNISPQPQPNEMFSRMAEMIGNHALHAEVEREISAAADFSIARNSLKIAQNSLEAAHRADQLQRLVSIGVPAGLAVGFGGMNIITQNLRPSGWFSAEFSDTATCSLGMDIATFGLILAAVFFFWSLLETVLNARQRSKEKWQSRLSKTPLAIALVAGLVSISLTAGCALNPNSPLESADNFVLKGEIIEETDASAGKDENGGKVNGHSWNDRDNSKSDEVVTGGESEGLPTAKAD